MTKRRAPLPPKTDAPYGFSRPVRLVEMLRQTLLREIRRRRWKSELPSERHLSRELRVSRPTLRLALHSLADEGWISLQPRRPCRISRRLRPDSRPARRNREIVLLYNARSKPDLTSLTTLVVLLQQKFHRLGFGLQLADVMPPGRKGLSTSLARIDSEYRPSIYLLSSVPTPVHRWFAQRTLPCLILGSRAPDIHLPAIEVVQKPIVEHAVGYLVRHGHRRIGFLQMPDSSIGALIGTEGFHQACASFSRQGVRGQVQTSVARPEAIAAAVRRMFVRPDPPTAVIFADLEFGIGLYTTLGNLGLHIPRQVSALSICHGPLLDFLLPRPTRYEFSWEKYVGNVVELVESYVRTGVLLRKSCTILPKLSDGDSVARLG